MKPVVEVHRLTYSVPQMAQALGISKSMAYQLAGRADFPKIKVGNRILIPVAEFESFIHDEATRTANAWANMDDGRVGDDGKW